MEELPYDILLIINGALIMFVIMASVSTWRKHNQILAKAQSKDTELDDVIQKLAQTHNDISDSQMKLDRKVDELRLRVDALKGVTSVR